MRYFFLVLAISLSAGGILEAQQPEWLMKVPSYFRLKGGGSFLLVDTMRRMVLFDGGAYDTYSTGDSGRTWKSVFDPKMFYMDVNARWQVDGSGRWYYTGNVYLKQRINLVTEDAGKNFRYLIQDTNDVPITPRWEPLVNVVPPASALFDLTIGYPEEVNGYHVTCDAGLTWSKLPRLSGYRGQMQGRVVKPGVISVSTSQRTSTEVDLCTGSMRPTELSSNLMYLRLQGDRAVQVSQEGVLVYDERDSLLQHYGEYQDPHSNSMMSMRAHHLVRINDTCAMIIGRHGEIFMYSLNAGLVALDLPASRSPYQQVVMLGRNDPLLVTLTYIPEGQVGTGARWNVIDVRNGTVKTFERPVFPIYDGFDPDLKYFRVVPFSEQHWYMVPQVGEIMQTTDAGRTWSMVDHIEQDSAWGESWIGLSRLFPRPDGRMAVLTDRGRLMLQPDNSSRWTVAHLGPFMHKVRLQSGRFSITGTNEAYMEDVADMLRTRLGPSTVYFPHPDTMWTSGDVLARHHTSGHLIDTILPRKTRYIRSISPDIIAAAGDSLYFTFNGGREWIYVGYDLPRSISHGDTASAAIGDIVMADNGTIIAGLRGIRMYDSNFVALDSIPGGLMYSTDQGNSWTRRITTVPDWGYVSSVFKNTETGTLFCVTSEVTADPNVYNNSTGTLDRRNVRYLIGTDFKLDRTFVYRSSDHGATWNQVLTIPDRELLSPTDARIRSMPDGRLMFIHPSYGLLISNDDGRTWAVGDPLNIGDVDVRDVEFTSDGHTHLATSEGYVRIKSEHIVSVSEQRAASSDKRISFVENNTLRLSVASIPDVVISYSLIGERFGTFIPTNSNVEIDVSSYPSGAYILVISYGDHAEKLMFIK